jgi:hypothetical protein
VGGFVVEGFVVLAGFDGPLVESGGGFCVDDGDAWAEDLVADAVWLVLERSPLIELAANSEATAAETEAKGTVSETSLWISMVSMM